MEERMKRSTDRILVTHAGRLSSNREITQQARNASTFRDWILSQTKEGVAKQIETGIDIISDGEFGKYGGFEYYSKRMTGLATRPVRPGEPAIMSARTNDRLQFDEFY